jgi:hypothetical protein
MKPIHAKRVLVIAAALSVATLTHAEERPPDSTPAAQAAQRKREGDEAFRALRYADALRAYDEGLTFVDEPTLHYNRARTLEALERFPEALDEFETFARTAPPQVRARAPGVAEHIQTLKGKIATVRFEVAPENARVLLRGVLIDPTVRGHVRTVAGRARVEIEADGFVTYSREHSFAADEETPIRITLMPKAAAESSPPEPVQTDLPHEQSKSLLSRWWFWAAASAVVAGGAVATYALTRPSSKHEADLGQLTAPLLRF